MSASSPKGGDLEDEARVGRIIDRLEGFRINSHAVHHDSKWRLMVGVLRLRLTRCYKGILGRRAMTEAGGSSAQLVPDSIEIPRGERVDSQGGHQSTFNDWMEEALDLLSSEYYGRTSKPQSTDFTPNEIHKYVQESLETATRLEELLQSAGVAGGENQLDRMRRKDVDYITSRPKANSADLGILEAHARTVDPTFADLLRSKVGHSYSNLRIYGKVVIGDEFVDNWERGAIGPTHTYVDILVGDKGIEPAGLPTSSLQLSSLVFSSAQR